VRNKKTSFSVLSPSIHTLCLKKHQLWNGTAQNYKDRKVDKKATVHENWNMQTLF